MFEDILSKIDCGFGDTASDDLGASAKEMMEAMTAELQKIGTNINQIARRVNATGTLYAQDMEDIKGAMAATIWAPFSRLCLPMTASMTLLPRFTR